MCNTTQHAATFPITTAHRVLRQGLTFLLNRLNLRWYPMDAEKFEGLHGFQNLLDNVWVVNNPMQQDITFIPISIENDTTQWAEDGDYNTNRVNRAIHDYFHTAFNWGFTPQGELEVAHLMFSQLKEEFDDATDHERKAAQLLFWVDSYGQTVCQNLYGYFPADQAAFNNRVSQVAWEIHHQDPAWPLRNASDYQNLTRFAVIEAYQRGRLAGI